MEAKEKEDFHTVIDLFKKAAASKRRIQVKQENEVKKLKKVLRDQALRQRKLMRRFEKDKEKEHEHNRMIDLQRRGEYRIHGKLHTLKRSEKVSDLGHALLSKGIQRNLVSSKLRNKIDNLKDQIKKLKK